MTISAQAHFYVCRSQSLSATGPYFFKAYPIFWLKKMANFQIIFFVIILKLKAGFPKLENVTFELSLKALLT